MCLSLEFAFLFSLLVREDMCKKNYKFIKLFSFKKNYKWLSLTMKFEEKIKQRYLYRPGFNLIKNLYFCIQALKSKKFIKKSYSGGAQDLIINYFFKNKKNWVKI